MPATMKNNSKKQNKKSGSKPSIATMFMDTDVLAASAGLMMPVKHDKMQELLRIWIAGCRGDIERLPERKRRGAYNYLKTIMKIEMLLPDFDMGAMQHDWRISWTNFKNIRPSLHFFFSCPSVNRPDVLRRCLSALKLQQSAIRSRIDY